MPMLHTFSSVITSQKQSEEHFSVAHLRKCKAKVWTANLQSSNNAFHVYFNN